MVLTEMSCLETSGKSEAEDAEMMDPAAGTRRVLIVDGNSVIAAHVRG